MIIKNVCNQSGSRVNQKEFRGYKNFVKLFYNKIKFTPLERAFRAFNYHFSLFKIALYA